MTWNANNPLSSDKIRAWPSAVTTSNWPQLETMISADHQFNATPAPNDNSGYHKVARWVNQAGVLGDNTPAVAPVANTSEFYTKTITYFQEGGTSAGTRQIPCIQPGNRASAAEESSLAAPIRAAVSFNTASAILGQAYNVTDVSIVNSQTFRITFDKPMPSVFYMVIATLNDTGTSVQSVKCTAKTTTTCDIGVANFDGVGSARQGLDVIIVGGFF